MNKLYFTSTSLNAVINDMDLKGSSLAPLKNPCRRLGTIDSHSPTLDFVLHT